MRTLTSKQKKLISDFINSQVNPVGSFERTQSVFKGYKHTLDADDIPIDLYDEIEAINCTEVHYQNVNRFMQDECCKLAYSK